MKNETTLLAHATPLSTAHMCVEHIAVNASAKQRQWSKPSGNIYGADTLSVISSPIRKHVACAINNWTSLSCRELDLGRLSLLTLTFKCMQSERCRYERRRRSSRLILEIHR